MTPANQSPDLDDLIAEYILASERGEAPDAADWLARHPDKAPELAAFLDDLGRFGTLLGIPQRSDPDRTTDFQHRELVRCMPDSERGERFGEYELLGELGRGGMGIVYRARITGTAMVVALKQIRPQRPDGTSDQFREEIKSAAELRHPNIVPVYHVGEHAGSPFYTMALVEGGSLDQFLGRYPGDPLAAAKLVVKVAQAVHYAHQRRILHRDLKPANILLDDAGEPHIADFGLAARMDASGAVLGGGPTAGSLPWMAPETVRGDPILTTAVDVWALGAILYELLTGRRPFGESTWTDLRRAILDRDPLPPRVVDPRLARDLDAICRKCLEKDPERRYESASAVALDLGRWLRDEPVRARPTGRGERVARWCRRNPGLTVAAAGLTVFLVAATTAALTLAREQDAQVRAAVCQGNEYAARGAAASVLWRLGELGDAVVITAGRPALHDAIRRRDWDVVREMVADRQRSPIPSVPGRPAFVTVFVLDPGGTIRAEFPRGAVEGKSYRGRDYFRRTIGYADRTGRDAVHVSRAFESDNDGLDKIAVSVPFRPDGPGSAVWVLGATITTDSTLGLENLHDGLRQTVLLAARDSAPPHEPITTSESPEYVVLLHHGYAAGQRSVPFRGGVLRPPTAAPHEAELQLPADGPSFAPDDNFTDPLATSRPEYAGRWLAGSAPVGNTELVVLVAQRYEDAVAPQQRFIDRFLAWVGGLVAAGLAAVAVLRLVRREWLQPKARQEI